LSCDKKLTPLAIYDKVLVLMVPSLEGLKREYGEFVIIRAIP
jgi:hypothetical protein